jgi:hypothetical protein
VALLSFDDELSRAVDKVPFANGFEFDSWSSIWCDECVHFDDCPLLLVILREKTPQSWEDVNPAALNRYHCHEFERKDDAQASSLQAAPPA